LLVTPATIYSIRVSSTALIMEEQHQLKVLG